MNKEEALNALGKSGVSSAACLSKFAKTINEAFEIKTSLVDLDGNKLCDLVPKDDNQNDEYWSFRKVEGEKHIYYLEYNYKLKPKNQ